MSFPSHVHTALIKGHLDSFRLVPSADTDLMFIGLTQKRLLKHLNVFYPPVHPVHNH